MAHRVVLKPSGHSFEVADGVNVLQAGLDAGYELPYSCRDGVCRTCRGTIVRPAPAMAMSVRNPRRDRLAINVLASESEA